VAAPPGEAARGRLQRLSGAVTYGAYRTASGIARALPNFAADGFAVPAGLGANLTRPERRAMIERQLRRVDPTLEGWRLRRAVQDAFDSYARYWIETFRLPTLPAKVVSDGFTEEGYTAHIEGGLAAGRGVILALPHLGGWEWAGRWLTDVGHRVTVIVEQLDPPELFDWFVRLRRDLGMTVVPLGPGAGRAVLKALADNEVVCLLCDRNIGAGGVEVEFFGERTLLPAGPATMAIRAGAPLLPVGAYFTPRPNGHHAVIGPPVPTARGGRLRDDVVRVTQDLTYALERLIRRAPSQWHMFLPNWPSDPGYEADTGRA
jgi:phosphatidylinositol dimannoside acyltransferase